MGDIKFLNVDLEVVARQPLDALIDDLGEDVAVLYHGTAKDNRWMVSFELNTGRTESAESAIDGFCELLDYLEAEAKAVWDSAVSRTFDIGYESGTKPRSFQSVIHPQMIERIAALNAGIVVTIYPPVKNDPVADTQGVTGE